MAEDMRLKGVTGQDLVFPVHKLNCNTRLSDDRNSNDILNSDDNSINRYCHQWSHADDSDTKNDDNINLNNNIAPDQEVLGVGRIGSCLSPSSCPEDDSYADYEGQSSSSADVSPQGDEYRCFSQEEVTDSDFSDDGNHYAASSFTSQGIVNPNYPGFQDFTQDVEESEDELTGTINNSNNNNDNNNREVEISESVNHLDSVENFQKAFYDKALFDIVNYGEVELDVKQENVDNPSVDDEHSVKGSDQGEGLPARDENSECHETVCERDWFVHDIVTTAVFPVSGIYETAILTDDDSDSTPGDDKQMNGFPGIKEDVGEGTRRKEEAVEKLLKETENERRADDAMKKEEKTQMNVTTKNNRKCQDKSDVSEYVTHRGKRSKHPSSVANRRSLPLSKDKGGNVDLGFFDVYNIETAMPKIDLDVIESHLRAAREEERRRRTDREEIRRRLAMGTDNDDYYGGERTLRKPSLQARLQSGMNLQICFMNETMSDNESPGSDCELRSSITNTINTVEENTANESDNIVVNKSNFSSIPPNHVRPSTSLLTLPLKKETDLSLKALTATDFLSCQAQLQAEARLALSQAKEMARMQIEVERQNLKTSPITEIVRCSLEKVGVQFPHDRRRLSRQILTEMNIAQLQVIVNYLHTQIEKLNENLVKLLIGRDDLHMEQDSMLVDIEDLTRYLGAKEKPQEVPNVNLINRNNNINFCQNQSRISVLSKD